MNKLRNKAGKTFDEYMINKTEVAMKSDHYNPSGNSDLANYNKGVMNSLMCSNKHLYREIKEILKQPVMDVSISDILGLLVVIPFFPVLVFLRVWHDKKRAKATLKEVWLR
tara:strand:- start:14521 stop:14853 length:333 start_codon:yes stop_codon:yes gene_type:complete